jgi:hypothetical protein
MKSPLEYTSIEIKMTVVYFEKFTKTFVTFQLILKN